MKKYHRWRLRVLQEQLGFWELQITKLEAKIQEQLCVYKEAITMCTTIPGIEAGAAVNQVPETGVNIAPFPSAQHLASWAGLCPEDH